MVPESCPHSPYVHRTHTTDGLYSLICLSAVQPTATEPKCNTFWMPSASWSSGRFCLMLTSSWAHLAGQRGGSLGEKSTRASVAPAEQPFREDGGPQGTTGLRHQGRQRKGKACRAQGRAGGWRRSRGGQSRAGGGGGKWGGAHCGFDPCRGWVRGRASPTACSWMLLFCLLPSPYQHVA